MLFLICMVFGNAHAAKEIPSIKDLFEQSKNFYNEAEYAFEIELKVDGKDHPSGERLTIVKGDNFFYLDRKDRSLLLRDDMTLMLHKRAQKILLKEASDIVLDFDVLEMNFFISDAFLSHENKTIKKISGKWRIELLDFQTYDKIVVELNAKDYHISSVSYHSKDEVTTANYNVIGRKSKDLLKKMRLEYYIKKRSGKYVVKDEQYQLLDYRNQSTQFE